MKIAMIMCTVALAVQPVMAQLQWSALDGLASKAKESVEITLDPATLQMANGFLSGAAKGGDAADAAKLLTGVKGITVRTYEFSSEGQYDANLVRNFAEQLVKQGWSRMVSVKDGKESFELYSKTEQGKNAGFAMIAAEPKELAVIHIDGSINLADLSKLGGQYGIPKIPIPGAQNDKKGKE